MARDFIDWVIERWSEERPDLDVSSIAVVGRLLRIADLLEQRFERLCREYGFSFWAFTVLTALRRAGKPYRLTPGQLHERRHGLGRCRDEADHVASRNSVWSSGSPTRPTVAAHSSG